MMRFQRVSPDCLPLSTGKKSSLRTINSACKEESNGQENGRAIQTFTSSMEGKSFRLRSLSRDRDYRHVINNGEGNPLRNGSQATTGSGGCGGGGVLLQWGQRKRARVSRLVTDDLYGMKARKTNAEENPKGSMVADKNSAATATMSLRPAGSFTCNGRIRNLRKECSVLYPSSSRNSEDQSVAASSSRVVSRSAAGKRSPPNLEKADRKMPCSEPAKDEKANGSDHRHAEQEAGNNNTAAAEKPNFEWPRIHIALSKKEREDDFLAMKGTKLPPRPKKRSKNVDKLLQYCFPGLWLADLTKSRYEVREKKCVKKQKRGRGLRGMEGMDSDSE